MEVEEFHGNFGESEIVIRLPGLFSENTKPISLSLPGNNKQMGSVIKNREALGLLQRPLCDTGLIPEGDAA